MASKQSMIKVQEMMLNKETQEKVLKQLEPDNLNILKDECNRIINNLASKSVMQWHTVIIEYQERIERIDYELEQQEIDKIIEFEEFRSKCSQSCEIEQPKGISALNLEYSVALAHRCMLKIPKHFENSNISGVRWILSGGHPSVLGVCSMSNCPLKTK